jgi:hypothetical protein
VNRQELSRLTAAVATGAAEAVLELPREHKLHLIVVLAEQNDGKGGHWAIGTGVLNPGDEAMSSIDASELSQLLIDVTAGCAQVQS